MFQQHLVPLYSDVICHLILLLITVCPYSTSIVSVVTNNGHLLPFGSLYDFFHHLSSNTLHHLVQATLYTQALASVYLSCTHIKGASSS